jgi:hypothetical protein
VERRKAGGGAEDAATASGGEVQHGQTAGDVARAGVASARAGSGGAEAGVARARAQRGTGAAGAAHMAGAEQRRRAAEKQGGGRER